MFEFFGRFAHLSSAIGVYFGCCSLFIYDLVLAVCVRRTYVSRSELSAGWYVAAGRHRLLGRRSAAVAAACRAAGAAAGRPGPLLPPLQPPLCRHVDRLLLGGGGAAPGDSSWPHQFR